MYARKIVNNKQYFYRVNQGKIKVFLELLELKTCDKFKFLNPCNFSPVSDSSYEF